MLSSCSFMKQREIKKASSEILTSEIQETLLKEQRSVVQGKNNRGKTFAQYVLDHTLIEISEIKEVTETDYLLEAKIHTINPEVRQIVLEILAPMDQATSNAFNFSEGLGRIHLAKPNLSIEVDQSLSLEVHNKDGHWVR